jgi:hypothetical protein
VAGECRWKKNPALTISYIKAHLWETRGFPIVSSVLINSSIYHKNTVLSIQNDVYSANVSYKNTTQCWVVFYQSSFCSTPEPDRS